MQSFKTVFLVPTFPEAKAFWKVSQPRLLRKEEGVCFYILPSSNPKLLMISGMGRQNTRNALEILMRHFRVKQIYLLGFAGALLPFLKTGDAFHLKKIKTSNGEVLKDSSERLPEFDQRFAFFRVGSGLCSDLILQTREEKQDAHKRSSCECVEMEGAALAEFCERHSLDWMHLRWVVDELKDEIPDVSSFIDSWGKLKAHRLLFSLLKKPRLCFELMRLGKRAFKASKSTEPFLKSALENL